MDDVGAGVFELAEEFHPDSSPESALWFKQFRALILSIGRPVTSACVSTRKSPMRYLDTLALIDEVAESGGRLYGQVNPHARSRR